MTHAKTILAVIVLLSYGRLPAQQIDSIYANLYTDSLKKGTLNYINIDAHLDNGRWLPLDSTQLDFSSSAGKFVGNCLWIDRDFKPEKVSIKVVLKNKPAVFREFDMYVKKRPDDEHLKTADEIINDIRNGRRKSKN